MLCHFEILSKAFRHQAAKMSLQAFQAITMPSSTLTCPVPSSVAGKRCRTLFKTGLGSLHPRTIQG